MQCSCGHDWADGEIVAFNGTSHRRSVLCPACHQWFPIDTCPLCDGTGVLTQGGEIIVQVADTGNKLCYREPPLRD